MKVEIIEAERARPCWRIYRTYSAKTRAYSKAIGVLFVDEAYSWPGEEKGFQEGQ